MTEQQPEWAIRMEAKVDLALARLDTLTRKADDPEPAGEMWGSVPTDLYPWGDEEEA